MNKYLPSLLLLTCASAVTETLIFEDNFDRLDFSVWKHDLTLEPGNGQFMELVNNRTNTYCNDSVLYIQPSLQSDMIGLDKMLTGEKDLYGTTYADYCTSNKDGTGCERDAGETGLYLQPTVSARLRTRDSFSFTYGRVEVRAQLPIGDWLHPAIWLMPKEYDYGAWPESGEIDIMESRGNDYSETCTKNNRMFASTLHYGPKGHDAWSTANEMYTHTEALGNDYHIFGLFWDEDGIRTYFDDEENINLSVIHNQTMWERGGFSADAANPWKWETDNGAPFNRDFYLILNVAVGGTNSYFADGNCEKPWTDDDDFASNTFWDNEDLWYPSWNYPDTTQAAMKVDYVKVWSFDSETKTEL